MNNIDSKELRLKSGPKILRYINNFSPTEKTIFTIFVVLAGISALVMLSNINNFFLTDIPSKGGQLREGVIGLPHTINPVLATTDVDRDISSLVFSGLMKYSGNNLVPDLAESYNVSEDGLNYTFKLRPDLKFHDGKPLTTEDIAFTIQKIQNTALKSPRRADWNNVVIEVISPAEIKFILKQPYSPFIANTTVGIIPKHIWNSLSDDQFIYSQNNIEPVGSGPYRYKQVVRNSEGIPTQYDLVLSDEYHNKSFYLSQVTFNFYSDYEKAITALENGNIDSLASVAPADAQRLASSTQNTYSIIDSTLPRIFGIFFNQNDNPALADKSVRQALDLTIDRKSIIDNVLYGYGSPILGPVPGENEDEVKVGENSSNLEVATAILKKAGWNKDPETGILEKKGAKNVIQVLTFNIYTADTPDLKRTAEIVRSYWSALGAKVDIKVFDSSELYQNIIKPRKYDALLFGQLIGKDRDLYAFWHSSQRNAPGLNVSMYTNSKADALLDKIRTARDPDIRKEAYKNLSTIIREDVPAIFIYSPDFIYVMPKNNNNQNFTINNITFPTDRFATIDSWYMKTEKVWKMFAKK